MEDKNLICFFSWGRTELTEKSFKNLLENVRPQDRLLVIDNEMLNFDLYAKHRDKIDFLTFFKLNYHIGPVWMYIYSIVLWHKSKQQTYKDLHKTKTPDAKRKIVKDEERYWYPDFINIVESDTLGKKGWIDRVLKLFEQDKRLGIVSGYNSDIWTKEDRGTYLVKKTVCGVNAIFDTDYFTHIAHYFERYGQDRLVSVRNRNYDKLVGILPNEIIHIGDKKGFRDL